REHGVAIRPAQKHTIAGDQPVFFAQQPRDAPAEIVEFSVGPAAMVVDDRERVGRTALEQFGGRVEAFRILQLGQIEVEFREQLRRGQAGPNEGVVTHSGTTAVASISINASGSTRALTATSAIAG